MNIIVSAGGTGGHIYPAIAIINKFKEKEKNLNILYIGTHNRMEKEIIPKMQIKYEELEIYGFSKKLIKRDLQNIFLIQKAKKKCQKIFQEFKPDVVIGTGGYVTLPVLQEAFKKKIPICIHEQNSIPGKTNKYLGKKASLICTSYEDSKKYFPKDKNVIYTGNPCGENVYNTKKITKESLNLSKNKKLVLIVAGSLGSNTINNFFTKVLSRVSDDSLFEVLYITGKSYYEDFIKDKKFSKNVKVLPYLDNMAGLLTSTDLIISRAGAGTIAEIIASSLPSILIPSPYVANNHQYYNALDLQKKKACLMMEEKDLDDNKLFILINNLLKDKNGEYEKMKANLQKLASKNASEIIYNEIKKVVING